MWQLFPNPSQWPYPRYFPPHNTATSPARSSSSALHLPTALLDPDCLIYISFAEHSDSHPLIEGFLLASLKLASFSPFANCLGCSASANSALSLKSALLHFISWFLWSPSDAFLWLQIHFSILRSRLIKVQPFAVSLWVPWEYGAFNCGKRALTKLFRAINSGKPYLGCRAGLPLSHRTSAAPLALWTEHCWAEQSEFLIYSWFHAKCTKPRGKTAAQERKALRNPQSHHGPRAWVAGKVQRCFPLKWMYVPKVKKRHYRKRADPALGLPGNEVWLVQLRLLILWNPKAIGFSSLS